jgi:predicted AAA+ superfamily ATPase
MISKDLLKTVLADAREEVAKYRVIPREFQFEEYGNYVFTGIRRAGKSFLLYQHMQELLRSGTGWDQIVFVNFEDERLIGMETTDLNLLLEIHLELDGKKPVLFLDEIQNVAGWETFARRLADTGHKVYITGSNAKMLSTDIQTTLGGRFVSVEVYPYSFKEFLVANGVSYNEKVPMSTETKSRLMKQFQDNFCS